MSTIRTTASMPVKIESTRRATPQEVAQFTRKVMDAIRPHAEEITEMAIAGKVAVLVLDPAGEDMRRAARAAGWDGKSDPAVFQMPDGVRRKVAEYSDAVTAAWLLREVERPRIFVFAELATYLLNFGAQGFYFEPGSLDSERA